jgi:hypothetical protein
METIQENSLHSYLCFKLAKISWFSFFFYFFFFYKIGEQEGRTVLWEGGGVGTCGRGEVVEKGGRRMNMMEIMCTHVYKCKNDTC